MPMVFPPNWDLLPPWLELGPPRFGTVGGIVVEMEECLVTQNGDEKHFKRKHKKLSKTVARYDFPERKTSLLLRAC